MKAKVVNNVKMPSVMPTMMAIAIISSAVVLHTQAFAETVKTSAAQVKKETAEAVDAAGTYAGEKKEEFATRMKNNIEAMDREIESLKKESASKSAEVREATKQKIRELQQKRDDLNAKYAAFEKSSGKAWTRMKSGMEKAWGEVRSAYSEAKSELSSKN